MAVYGTANKLAREIKNSEEYSNYQEIRQKIMGDEPTRKMLQDYIKQQLQIQSKKMSGEELTEEEKQEIERLNNLVEINSSIKKYLQAEYQMSTMLNDLQNILFGDLEIGIMEEDEMEAEESNQAQKNQSNDGE